MVSVTITTKAVLAEQMNMVRHPEWLQRCSKDRIIKHRLDDVDVVSFQGRWAVIVWHSGTCVPNEGWREEDGQQEDETSKQDDQVKEQQAFGGLEVIQILFM